MGGFEYSRLFFTSTTLPVKSLLNEITMKSKFVMVTFGLVVEMARHWGIFHVL